MGILFSKIEKYFDKKYRHSNYNYKYDYEYDSIIKSEEKDDVELEEDAFIYDNNNNVDPKTRINYYNKKLEGIMYL
jgi:hypothetical protein